MNHEDYLTAKAIIIKCLKSKKDKQPFDFKRWEFLDYDAKRKALFDMTCPYCHKIKLLTGSYSGIFGTDEVCQDCSDEKNYPHLFKDNKRLPLWEVQI